MADHQYKPEPNIDLPAMTELQTPQQDQQAATAQGAELNGATTQTDPKAGQADEVREAERVAAAKKSWESVLGSVLGGKAFDLIREHMSFSDVQGYAKQGTAALAGLASAPFSKGETLTAKDATALNALAKAFAPELQKLADGWITGSGGKKVSTALSQWVEQNPKAVTAIAAGLGAIAIGAAVVAIIADADPPELKQMFKLGKGFEAGGKIDIASIKNFAVQSAELSMKYNAGGFSAQLTGATKAGDDGHTQSASASVGYKKDGVELGANAALDGATGETTAGATAAYKTTGFEASADVKHSSADGTTGGAKVKGEGGSERFKGDYLASISVNAEGETEVVFNGGVQTVIADLPASMRAGIKHGSGADGKTTVNAEMSIGEKGNQQTVKGSLDPKTGAFTLNFGRTAAEGAASVKKTMGQDADGNVTETDAMKYTGDGIALEASQTRDGAGKQTGANVGLDFTTGTFKNSLDLKMKDTISELSLGTAGTVGLGSGELKLAGNTTLDFEANRLKTLGLSLGWQDPNAFSSATLKYKLDWQKANGAYAHNFESVFEHSVGKWSGRLSGGLQLQGGNVDKANADLLMGRDLNPRWKMIGGMSGGTEMMGGQRQNKIGARLGVQFDNIAVTFGAEHTLGGKTVPQFRLEIPLGKR
ncbi:MAG: hypothetical protein ACI9U2_004251 [Bradymonadia bacterium]|jgi:hypothetical protein